MFCNIILVIRKALQMCFSYAQNVLHQQKNKLMQIKNKQKHKCTKLYFFENHFSQKGVAVLHDRLFSNCSFLTDIH